MDKSMGIFEYRVDDLRRSFLSPDIRKTINGSTWHQQPHEMKVHELRNVVVSCPTPKSIEELQDQMSPNLPWAEDHFLERVNPETPNPPPSAAHWPFAQQGHVAHVDRYGGFSHTYPERFWPKWANYEHRPHKGLGRPGYRDGIIPGIRYRYGDLSDVVKLLAKDPATRQAYLPVWFPEDTGNQAEVRVPCSLGYHFEIRDNRLTVNYLMRSCDFMRHFRDDMYMAARLGQWVAEEVSRIRDREAGPDMEVEEVTPSWLYAHIINLHVFDPDLKIMRVTGKP